MSIFIVKCLQANKTQYDVVAMSNANFCNQSLSEVNSAILKDLYPSGVWVVSPRPNNGSNYEPKIASINWIWQVVSIRPIHYDPSPLNSIINGQGVDLGWSNMTMSELALWYVHINYVRQYSSQPLDF